MTPATGGTGPGTVSPTITFSEPVTLADAAISLDCSTSGAAAFSVSGGPTTRTGHPVLVPPGPCHSALAGP